MSNRLPMPDELTSEQRKAFAELRSELRDKYGVLGDLLLAGRSGHTPDRNGNR